MDRLRNFKWCWHFNGEEYQLITNPQIYHNLMFYFVAFENKTIFYCNHFDVFTTKATHIPTANRHFREWISNVPESALKIISEFPKPEFTQKHKIFKPEIFYIKKTHGKDIIWNPKAVGQKTPIYPVWDVQKKYRFFFHLGQTRVNKKDLICQYSGAVFARAETKEELKYLAQAKLDKMREEQLLGIIVAEVAQYGQSPTIPYPPNAEIYNPRELKNECTKQFNPYIYIARIFGVNPKCKFEDMCDKEPRIKVHHFNLVKGVINEYFAAQAHKKRRVPQPPLQ